MKVNFRELSERGVENALLSVLQKYDFLVTREIARRINIDQRTAMKYLKKLHKKGKVKIYHFGPYKVWGLR